MCGKTASVGVFLLSLAALFAGCLGLAPRGGGLTVADRMEEARTLYQEGQIHRARRIFETLSDRSRYDDACAEEASFYLGECCYQQRDYVAALRAYRALLKDFWTVRYFKDAIRRMFSIGAAYCLGHVSSFRKGRGFGADVLKEALSYQLYGDYSAQARLLIGDYYLDKGNYEEALVQYELLITEYSDTAEAVQSQYRKALCLYHMVRGNAYDSAELQEAIRQMEVAREVAAGQAESKASGERLSDIRRKLDELRESGARENYDLGRFFLKNGNKVAAATYFNQVIEDAPESAYAKLARKKLGVIAQEFNR